MRLVIDRGSLPDDPPELDLVPFPPFRRLLSRHPQIISLGRD